MASVKVIIEQHSDGFVAYPVGLKGVCVAQGDTREEVVSNIESAIRFHLETFGQDVLEDGDLVSISLAELPIAS